MILENLVPDVYYDESRDFAYIGRVIEVLLNYMKSSADCVSVHYNNDAASANIVDLLADSLGFTAKHAYNLSNLVAIVNSFQTMLRYKGSIVAIDMAIKILMNVQKLMPLTTLGDVCQISDDDPYLLNIYLPEDLDDIVLLEDLFDYLLPAGMYYVIHKVASGSGFTESEIDMKSTIDGNIYSNDYPLANINNDILYNKHSDILENTVLTGFVSNSNAPWPQTQSDL